MINKIRIFDSINKNNTEILLRRGEMMARVSINKNAPDFELTNFEGKIIRLSDYRNKKNILLVFNRGFN